MNDWCCCDAGGLEDEELLDLTWTRLTEARLRVLADRAAWKRAWKAAGRKPPPTIQRKPETVVMEWLAAELGEQMRTVVCCPRCDGRSEGCWLCKGDEEVPLLQAAAFIHRPRRWKFFRHPKVLLQAVAVDEQPRPLPPIDFDQEAQNDDFEDGYGGCIQMLNIPGFAEWAKGRADLTEQEATSLGASWLTLMPGYSMPTDTKAMLDQFLDAKKALLARVAAAKG